MSLTGGFLMPRAGTYEPVFGSLSLIKPSKQFLVFLPSPDDVYSEIGEGPFPFTLTERLPG